MFTSQLQAFDRHPPLRQRILTVLRALPDDVRQDLLEDPRFHIAPDNYVPGAGSTVWMATPGTPGQWSRSVVLRLRLADCSEPFALYVIAHSSRTLICGTAVGATSRILRQPPMQWQPSWGFARP